jgi:NAD(P)-dependent dehydrogenase (short-subunit alcohol dehydrogenase family)
MKLNGKVAWVVGASSGIGAAAARELASRGGTVAPQPFLIHGAIQAETAYQDLRDTP